MNSYTHVDAQESLSMKLWHNTDDTPRLPCKVLEGQRVELWVATHPIMPWQYVMVDWTITHLSGRMESGNLPATRKHNEYSLGQSYWVARVGPFLKGDHVRYRILGASHVETLKTQIFAFNVE